MTPCPHFKYVENTQVGTGFSGEEGGIPPFAASVTTLRPPGRSLSQLLYHESLKAVCQESRVAKCLFPRL